MKSKSKIQFTGALDARCANFNFLCECGMFVANWPSGTFTNGKQSIIGVLTRAPYHRQCAGVTTDGEGLRGWSSWLRCHDTHATSMFTFHPGKMRGKHGVSGVIIGVKQRRSPNCMRAWGQDVRHGRAYGLGNPETTPISTSNGPTSTNWCYFRSFAPWALSPWSPVFLIFLE